MPLFNRSQADQLLDTQERWKADFPLSMHEHFSSSNIVLDKALYTQAKRIFCFMSRSFYSKFAFQTWKSNKWERLVFTLNEDYSDAT